MNEWTAACMFQEEQISAEKHLNASTDLALHKPMKYQCDICTEYEVGNIQYNGCQIHNNEEERGTTSGQKSELSLSRNNIDVIYSDQHKVVITGFAMKYMLL